MSTDLKPDFVGIHAHFALANIGPNTTFMGDLASAWLATESGRGHVAMFKGRELGILGATEQKTRLRNQGSSLGMRSIIRAESMRNVAQLATKESPVARPQPSKSRIPAAKRDLRGPILGSPTQQGPVSS
jgi:hypothetical protein